MHYRYRTHHYLPVYGIDRPWYSYYISLLPEHNVPRIWCEREVVGCNTIGWIGDKTYFYLKVTTQSHWQYKGMDQNWTIHTEKCRDDKLQVMQFAFHWFRGTLPCKIQRCSSLTRRRQTSTWMSSTERWSMLTMIIIKMWSTKFQKSVTVLLKHFHGHIWRIWVYSVI